MAQSRRITMQDIADACGLSRNTVSKVFNGHPGVPEATRDHVLAVAQELGYHQLTGLSLSEEPKAVYTPKANKNIALLTNSKPMNHSFGVQFITSFTNQISRAGYNLRIFEISSEECASLRLPSHMQLSDISSIVGIELFDWDYSMMISNLGVPVLFVDGHPNVLTKLMNYDLVYMENYASSVMLTEKLLAAGARRIGFVGDISHCASFRLRWDGYRTTLEQAGYSIDPKVCILANDTMPYGEVSWLEHQLDTMPYIPDAFVCANDFIAIRMMQCLQHRGLSVPVDVMVTGFDDSPESAFCYPPLTTVHIPSAEIGKIAADILLNRIQNPDFPCRCTMIQTTPVLRDSTR